MLSYINAALVEQTGQLAAELAHVHDDAGVHVQVDRASALPVNNPIQTKCIRRKIRAEDTDSVGYMEFSAWIQIRIRFFLQGAVFFLSPNPSSEFVKKLCN